MTQLSTNPAEPELPLTNAFSNTPEKYNRKEIVLDLLMSDTLIKQSLRKSAKFSGRVCGLSSNDMMN